MRCPISFIPLDELEHPVVFRNQKTITIYDASHLIAWLKTSRRNPVTNELVHPLTPFRDFLLPYRLPHTTDAQFARTQQLLVRGEASVLYRYAAALKAQALPAFDVVITPFVMCLSILLTMAAITIATDAMLHIVTEAVLKVPRELQWAFRALMQGARSHARVILSMNLIYVHFFHRCIAAIVRIYLGSDVVVWCWCAALLAVDASPLLAHHNATGITAMDVLLRACE